MHVITLVIERITPFREEKNNGYLLIFNNDLNFPHIIKILKTMFRTVFVPNDELYSRSNSFHINEFYVYF